MALYPIITSTLERGITRRRTSPRQRSLVPALTSPTVGIIGDSTMQSVGVFAGLVGSVNTGETYWAKIFWPNFRSNVYQGANPLTIGGFDGYNQAHSGFLIADCVPNLTRLLTFNPHIVCISVGTNDIVTGGTTAEQIVTALQSLAEQARMAGSIVILWNIRPYADPTINPGVITQPMRDKVDAVNALLAAWMRPPTIILFDVHAIYADQTSPQQAKANYLSDHVHPSMLGAVQTGYALVDVFARLAAAVPRVYPVGVVGTVFFTDFANTRMQAVAPGGQPGTAGVGIVGAVAENWQINRFAGSVTAVASFDATHDASQKLVVTGGGTALSSLYISRAFGGLFVPLNDWYQYVFEVMFDSWAGWRGIELTSNVGGNANGGTIVSQDTIGLSSPRILRLESCINQCADAAAQTVQAKIHVDGSVPGTGTCYIQYLGITVVPPL